jgi:hypothetical protein
MPSPDEPGHMPARVHATRLQVENVTAVCSRCSFSDCPDTPVMEAQMVGLSIHLVGLSKRLCLCAQHQASGCWIHPSLHFIRQR